MSVPYYFMGVGVCWYKPLFEGAPTTRRGRPRGVGPSLGWEGPLARYSLGCSKDLSILGKRDPNIFRHKIDYHSRVVVNLSVTAFRPLHSVINFVLLIGGRERPSRFGRAKRFDPYDGRSHFTPRIQARLYPTFYLVHSRFCRRTMINAVLRRYR